MSRHIKSKQTFATSAVKLLLDKNLILKTRASARVELSSYTVAYGKTFFWQEEKTKREGKRD